MCTGKEFSQSENVIYQDLKERYDPYYDYGPAFQRANAGSLVMAETSNFLKYSTRQDYTNK